MSKATAYREMTDDELNVALSEAGENLFNLKLQQTLGQLENPAQIQLTRRNIARIQTVLNERAATQQETENV